MDAPSNLLLVGEGNFSFAFSLLRKLQCACDNKEWRVTATSFDSHEQLVRKYPECVHSLKWKRSGKGFQDFVTVLHDVDATRLDSDPRISDRKYDQIIFNFPHLATEDCNLHSSLLAHFMHSAVELLASSSAIISITLGK
jgi:hypothetical protein